MKILNCFKVVPELDLIAEEDWAADDQLQVDTGYVKLLWNCFDESSLELVLKLSDLSEGFDAVYELNALTVGKEKHTPFLKILYALGYKKVTRIKMEEDCSFCPERIAEAVKNYICEYAVQDVVVMGVQSSDGSNMKTPLLLAERLGWPCITQVIGLEPVDEQHLKVTSQEDQGVAVQVVKVPCVLAVGNAPGGYLRVPTLRDKMRLGKQPVEVLEPDQLGLLGQEQPVVLVALHAVDQNRSGTIIEGNTPQEKAERLYHSYLKGRLEKL